MHIGQSFWSDRHPVAVVDVILKLNEDMINLVMSMADEYVPYWTPSYLARLLLASALART